MYILFTLCVTTILLRIIVPRISSSSLLWLPTKWTQYLEPRAISADAVAIGGVEALLATTNQIDERSQRQQTRQLIHSLGQLQGHFSI